MVIDPMPLVAHLPGWALVLFRITGLFFFAPVFGSRAVPAKVKAMLALGLSFCVYPLLLGPGHAASAHFTAMLGHGLSLWTLIGTVAAELMVGLVIGYGATMPLLGMQLGGRVIDQQLGLGLAGVLNPEFDEQTGVISEFFFILALTIFLILGGHRLVIGCMVGSFERIPPGGFVTDADTVGLVLGLVVTIFDLSLRVAAPVLCLIFLETIAMGFIARTVPQMNILSIGFALRIVMGTTMLIGAVSVTTAVYTDSLGATLSQLRRFFVP